MSLQENNHIEVVSKALATEATPSGEVYDSVAALATKLDALKRQGGLFAAISFSPKAQELADCCQVLS